MVGKHAVAGMASGAEGDWLVGDVRGYQAATRLGLSRTLIWHRLQLLPAIGGTSVPFPSERLGSVRRFLVGRMHTVTLRAADEEKRRVALARS